MSTAVTVLAVAWTGLIILGLVPEWGARVGLWLRRGDGDLPPAPPLNRSLSNRYSGDPRSGGKDEKHIDSHEHRLDRYV